MRQSLDPDRLWSPALRQLWAVFDQHGIALRLVGGCVRDAWLGITPHDLDLATPAPPEQVIDLIRQAGLEAVPTGLAHGTVTAVGKNWHAEITTLRRDVTTDGRHATIAYTDDWQQDAHRRDFTINALSMDQTGQIFDFCDGLADLAARRVRFIGDPAQRIAEDYLRILRFFRFHARFGGPAPDPDAIAACAAGRDGLKQLSVERIAGEMRRLLVGPRPVAMLGLMRDYGILSVLSPHLVNIDRLARVIDLMPDAGWRLRALLPDQPKILLDFATAWRLPVQVRQDWQQTQKIPVRDPAGFAHALYHQGVAAGRIALILADIPENAPVWQILRTWPPERLPITGHDVMIELGQNGPAIGITLTSIEQWWVMQIPRPDRAACLEKLKKGSEDL